MHVLIVPSWYPNGKDKLMGIYHKEYAEALAQEKDIKVNMLYIDRQIIRKPLTYLKAKKWEVEEEKGYKVYIKKMLDVHRISASWQMKRYVEALEEAFKVYVKENGKPDIIHAQVCLPAGYAACVIGKKYNIKVVISEHASYFPRFFQGKNKKYGDYIIKEARICAVSNFMAKKFCDEFKVKCEVLPNLVDMSNYQEPRIKEKNPLKIKLVSVCALRQGKRIDDIMKAMKVIEAEDKRLDISLTVVGDGFLEDYYKKQAQELQIADKVLFVGRKNKQEIASIFRESTMLVIASEYETFAIPGIEALGAGLPVVATKCLGPEEYIDDTCGRLVEVADIKALAKAILDVYYNKDKFKEESLRARASKYSKESVVEKALKIYKELLK